MHSITVILVLILGLCGSWVSCQRSYFSPSSVDSSPSSFGPQQSFSPSFSGFSLYPPSAFSGASTGGPSEQQLSFGFSGFPSQLGGNTFAGIFSGERTGPVTFAQQSQPPGPASQSYTPLYATAGAQQPQSPGSQAAGSYSVPFVVGSAPGSGQPLSISALIPAALQDSVDSGGGGPDGYSGPPTYSGSSSISAGPGSLLVSSSENAVYQQPPSASSTRYSSAPSSSSASSSPYSAQPQRSPAGPSYAQGYASFSSNKPLVTSYGTPVTSYEDYSQQQQQQQQQQPAQQQSQYQQRVPGGPRYYSGQLGSYKTSGYTPGNSLDSAGTAGGALRPSGLPSYRNVRYTPQHPAYHHARLGPTRTSGPVEASGYDNTGAFSAASQHQHSQGRYSNN